MGMIRLVVAAAAATALVGVVVAGADRIGRPAPLDGAAATAGVVPASRLKLRDPLPKSIDVVGEVARHGGAASGTVTVRAGAVETRFDVALLPQFTMPVAAAAGSDMVTITV